MTPRWSHYNYTTKTKDIDSLGYSFFSLKYWSNYKNQNYMYITTTLGTREKIIDNKSAQFQISSIDPKEA